MGKGAMPEIVTQTSKLYTFDISVCNSQLWLPVLKMLNHTTGQIGNP